MVPIGAGRVNGTNLVCHSEGSERSGGGMPATVATTKRP
jgi:predicted CxxxxCH...CXXCH cytochrome family protein